MTLDGNLYLTSSIVFLLLGTVGCATRPTAIPSVRELVDLPPINTVQSVELGDSLVQKAEVYFSDGVTISGAIRRKGIEIPEQSLPATHSTPWRIFYSGKNVSVLGRPVFGGVYEDPGSGTWGVWTYAFTGQTETLGDVSVKRVRVVSIDQPSFKQELIYSGRSGDQIRFLYREFRGDLLRPGFTQEVQYDLTHDTLIGFKGLRIRVISATNAEIEYEVLQSFNS